MKVKAMLNEHDTDIVELYTADMKYFVAMFHVDNLHVYDQHVAKKLERGAVNMELKEVAN